MEGVAHCMAPVMQQYVSQRYGCCRDLRRGGHLGEFVNVHLQNDACYISADGGRVCRPLIICDNGVPRITSQHIAKLKAGEWDFQDFLRAGC